MNPQVSFESVGSLILERERLIGVDVGACNFLPGHWFRFIGNSFFYLVEPHPQSRMELETTCKNTGRPHEFKILGAALSGQGGNRLLYKTNCPSGSSLLEPNLNTPYLSFEDDYFFPISVEPVATKTLKEVMDLEGQKQIDTIKLDTEGTELEILQGLDPDRLQSLLVVESEIQLRGNLAGRTNFPDFHHFMGVVGMELCDVRVNRCFPRPSKKSDSFHEKYLKIPPTSASVAARAYQFDVVYFRTPGALLASGDAIAIRKLVFCYCVYNYFVDALRLLELAKERGLLSQIVFEELIELVRALHAINQQQTGVVDQILAITKGQTYSQYTWVPYPA